MKLLEKKLKKIKSSSSYKPSDFIIADAKDADMGGGIRATGYIRKAEGHKDIFGLNSKSKEFQADGKYTVIVKNWFFVKDKNEITKELQKYWKDDFEEILKDALNSKK